MTKLADVTQQSVEEVQEQLKQLKDVDDPEMIAELFDKVGSIADKAAGRMNKVNQALNEEEESGDDDE
jgi:hypothetical protein